MWDILQLFYCTSSTDELMASSCEKKTSDSQPNSYLLVLGKFGKLFRCLRTVSHFLLYSKLTVFVLLYCGLERDTLQKSRDKSCPIFGLTVNTLWVGQGR